MAQHSLHVCEVLAMRKAPAVVQLHGLLHDAHEAYTGDIMRPVKLALKAHGHASRLAAIEDEIQFTILQAFNMPVLSLGDCAKIDAADDDVLATEFRDLMPESDFKPHGTPCSFRILPKPWDVAEEKFLRKFHDLVAILGVTPIMGALE